MADVENSFARSWVTLIVDGEPRGIMIEDSAAHQKEVSRLRGLHGIQWRKATDEDLKKFRRTIVDYETKRQKAAEKRAAARGE